MSPRLIFSALIFGCILCPVHARNWDISDNSTISKEPPAVQAVRYAVLTPEQLQQRIRGLETEINRVTGLERMLDQQLKEHYSEELYNMRPQLYSRKFLPMRELEWRKQGRTVLMVPEDTPQLVKLLGEYDSTRRQLFQEITKLEMGMCSLQFDNPQCQPVIENQNKLKAEYKRLSDERDSIVFHFWYYLRYLEK